jgi:hypothetical protein
MITRAEAFRSGVQYIIDTCRFRNRFFILGEKSTLNVNKMRSTRSRNCAIRECVDHMVVLGEAHLRRILTKYATYYNELRTHRSLNKDAPIRRAIQHVGRIVSAPVLGGLHHHYCRI